MCEPDGVVIKQPTARLDLDYMASVQNSVAPHVIHVLPCVVQNGLVFEPFIDGIPGSEASGMDKKSLKRRVKAVTRRLKREFGVNPRDNHLGNVIFDPDRDGWVFIDTYAWRFTD